MRVRRTHVLGAGVAAVAAAAVTVGTGLGFADTAPGSASACTGSVTFSAEGGAPAATSNRFPVGTTLRVTNLDNGKVTTVSVAGPSGSCVLLNASAMDQVREPGKNVVRRNTVEVLTGGEPPSTVVTTPDPTSMRSGAASPPAVKPVPASACSGSITFFAEGGAPAATSGQFPVGTRLRVTNLDNSKAVTVRVTGPSGSCLLLNAAAMDAIREPGKNLVRRNTVEVLR